MTVDAMQGALFTHRNHYLFADYYLDRRTHERQEWREADAGSAFATMTTLWRRFKPQGDNEAQTEADWIRPVLEALGHHYNVQVGRLATALGYRVILWTDNSGDYNSPGTKVIQHRVLRRTEDGDIILFHDGIEQTLDVLPGLVNALRAKGYRFVTVDEMTNSH